MLWSWCLFISTKTLTKTGGLHVESLYSVKQSNRNVFTPTILEHIEDSNILIMKVAKNSLNWIGTAQRERTAKPEISRYVLRAWEKILETNVKCFSNPENLML